MPPAPPPSELDCLLRDLRDVTIDFLAEVYEQLDDEGIMPDEAEAAAIWEVALAVDAGTACPIGVGPLGRWNWRQLYEPRPERPAPSPAPAPELESPREMERKLVDAGEVREPWSVPSWPPPPQNPRPSIPTYRRKRP